MKKRLLPIDIKLDYSLPIDPFNDKKKRVSVNKAERFHKKRRHIPSIVRSQIDNHEIVYGARALNKRFPPFLDKYTEDYDIYTHHPKRDARETERALDKKFGGDFFRVVPAQHPNTFRVKSNVDGSIAADYTKPEEKIPSDRIDGISYVKLSHVKKTATATLNDSSSSYRHDRDRDVLNRIKIYEKNKRGR